MMKGFLQIVLCLFCFFSVCSISVQGQSDASPNIVFIFTDDLAYQAISAYGHGLNNTPNLDRLAAEGMLFSRCVVTNSICGPSRATILTGKYSHLNGFYRNERQDFDGSQQTFPKLLQRNGYQTAIVGKWHLGSEPTGFDYWEVMRNQGSYYNPDLITAKGERIAKGYSVEVVRERAIHWMETERDSAHPFLLMVQFKAPHREWEPGPDYLNKYDDHIFPEPPTLFDNYAGRASGARDQKMTIAQHMVLEGDNKLYNEKTRSNPRGRSYARMTEAQKNAWDKAYDPKNEKFYQNNLGGDDLTRWKYQRYMQDYMSVVAAIDDNVGKLLDYLDEQQLSENTLVVFTSDQGFYLGEHGWFDKRWMYEESFRTPLLVRWPGKVKAGFQHHAIVSNLDFAETFLDVAGIEVPADMQGASLAPLFSGTTPPDWRKSFYYRYYEGGGHGVPEHEGVYQDSMKLIHYYKLGEWEMFDLRRDPHEMYSVYSNPEYSSEKDMLETELAALRQKLKVPPDLPNVIIIYSDDQGYGDVSFNEHHAPIHTPNIDRLADEGIIFTDGYVCAGTCAPSRAGLMSGRYPGRLGIYTVDDPFQEMPVSEKIAPEFFRENGYVTGIIGKWHLGGEIFKERFPTRRGFDRFYGWLNSTHDYWKANTGRSDIYGPNGYAPLYDQEEPVENMDQYLTRHLTTKALEFIDENRDRPFFLYFPHHCAHVPLQVPKETYDRYQSLDFGKNTITTRAMYEELDKSVGAILNLLERYQIRDNTIIIFQSDNGGGEPEAQLNWIYRGGKFTLLEGGIRVPTVISWPASLPKGKVYGYPVINIDFLPTLLDAVGIKTDKDFEGISLLPYLKGVQTESPHKALFWKVNEQFFAVRKGDWKLVFTANGQGLFNLKEDPSELRDLRASYPEKAAELYRDYKQWDKDNRPVAPTPEEESAVHRALKNPDPAKIGLGYSAKFGGERPKN